MLKEYFLHKITEFMAPDMPLAPGLVKHEGELAEEQIVPNQHHIAVQLADDLQS